MAMTEVRGVAVVGAVSPCQEVVGEASVVGEEEVPGRCSTQRGGVPHTLEVTTQCLQCLPCRECSAHTLQACTTPTTPTTSPLVPTAGTAVVAVMAVVAAGSSRPLHRSTSRRLDSTVKPRAKVKVRARARVAGTAWGLECQATEVTATDMGCLALVGLRTVRRREVSAQKVGVHCFTAVFVTLTICNYTISYAQYLKATVPARAMPT